MSSFLSQRWLYSHFVVSHLFITGMHSDHWTLHVANMSAVFSLTDSECQMILRFNDDDDTIRGVIDRLQTTFGRPLFLTGEQYCIEYTLQRIVLQFKSTLPRLKFKNGLLGSLSFPEGLTKIGIRFQSRLYSRRRPFTWIWKPYVNDIAWRKRRDDYIFLTLGIQWDLRKSVFEVTGEQEDSLGGRFIIMILV